MNKKNQKPPAATVTAITDASLDDVMTEKEVLDFFGVPKASLDRLRREKGLPYCRVNNVSRLYLVRDIFDYITSQRIVATKQE